jgi:hypothetical protein
MMSRCGVSTATRYELKEIVILPVTEMSLQTKKLREKTRIMIFKSYSIAVRFHFSSPIYNNSVSYYHLSQINVA